MTSLEHLIVVVLGFLAGFVDSIAGGGGLITFPSLGIVVGIGPETVATNKIVGTVAALIAFLIYARSHPIPWGPVLRFSAIEMAGAVVGTRLAPLLPREFYLTALCVVAPLILWALYRRDLWLAVDPNLKKSAPTLSVRFIGSALLVGLYEGCFGPGGGTLMLLALFVVIRLPLMTAIAGSKLVNTLSAGTSLVAFIPTGLIHWELGLWMSLGVGFGAALGASIASKRAAQIVRPVLAVVASLLLLRVIWDFSR